MIKKNKKKLIIKSKNTTKRKTTNSTDKINILIIGSGGREHALANKILQSTKCNKLFAIPGNTLWKGVNSIGNININNSDQIVKFAIENNIKLTIIGPEKVLKNNLVDKLNEHKLVVFAPNKKAAQIETNKEFSKNLMSKYNIPTAKFWSFKNFLKAKKFVDNLKNEQFPIVIKSSNLASGKGVVIAKDNKTAIDYLNELLNKNKYGNNNIAVIEEFLEGNEFSFMCLVNNEKIYPLPPVQDHKTINDNNEGLNTGGMGVISDPKFLKSSDITQVIESCITPLTKALAKEHIDYLGVVFAGIMQTKDKKYKVIEYNARWGDPETGIVLEKLNCDIVEFILAVIDKKDFKYQINKERVSGVVVCAKGYPEKFNRNLDVSFIKNEKNVYHMGTKLQDNKIISSSGRIFMIFEKDLKEDTSKLIYSRLEELKLDNNKFHYRKDINWN